MLHKYLYGKQMKTLISFAFMKAKNVSEKKS